MNDNQEVTQRRLDVGDILSTSFRGIFGPRFAELLVPCLVMAGLWVLMFLAFYPSFNELIIENWDLEGEDVSSAFFGPFVKIWATAMLGSALMYLYFVPYLLHRIYLVMNGGYEPVATTIRRVLDYRITLRLAISLILGIILYMIGGLFLVLPGLAMIPVVMMIPACATFDDGSRFFSLGSAFEIMGKNYGRTAGVVVIIGACVFLVSMVLSIPTMFSQGNDFAYLANETDPEVILDAQKDMWFSPMYIVPAVINGLVQIYAMLALLFSTALIYFNDRYEKKGFEAGDQSFDS